jgi:hypothetical protein
MLVYQFASVSLLPCVCWLATGSPIDPLICVPCRQHALRDPHHQAGPTDRADLGGRGRQLWPPVPVSECEEDLRKCEKVWGPASTAWFRSGVQPNA